MKKIQPSTIYGYYRRKPMLNIKIKDLLMTLELCLKVVVCNSREETIYVGTVEDIYRNRHILGNRTIHKLIPGARGIKIITEDSYEATRS